MKYLSADPRNGNWLYRHQLPSGKWFIRSMETSDRKLAEAKWSTVDAEFTVLADQQRSRTRYVESKDLRRDKFWGAVARFLIHQRAGNGGTLPRPVRVELPTSTEFNSHPFTYVRWHFLAWCQQHDPDALDVFHMGDATTEQLFHLGVVASYFVASEMERLEQPRAPEIAQPVPITAPEVPSGGHTLEQARVNWVKETNPAESTRGDVQRALAIFYEANPPEDPASPRSVEQIKRFHLQRMRGVLSDRKLSNGTRNKRIAGISLLLGQAMREFWIDSNPCVGVKFEVKDGETSEREGFTREELKRWLSIPAFQRHKFGSYGWSEYWIPLLAIFHGARRGEIAQLFTTDVFKEDGHWCLNIDGVIGGIDGIPPKHGIVQKIKNAGSRRRIPIHPAIIKAGFLDWVKTLPPGRLFENIPQEKDGTFNQVSKFVRDQLNLAKVSRELGIHCARHTYRTFSREADISEEVTDCIVGHAESNQGRKYGKVPISTMAKAMAKMHLGALPRAFSE